MIQLTFLGPGGQRDQVTAPAGDTVMDAALDNGVPGITAQCGGGCTCCTCHCYVPLTAGFAPPVQDELDLLEYALERRATSRLSCQLTLTEAHDGLVIRVPLQQA